MTKKDLDEIQKMMVFTFNDGFNQVVIPRLEEMEERFETKMDQVEKRIKDELREEFKRGQKSLSNRLEEVEVDISEMKSEVGGIKSNMEEMNGKMDQVLEKNKDYGKRLNRVERIVKAN